MSDNDGAASLVRSDALLALIDSTWPQSLWLQRMSPSTAVRDCGPAIQQEADSNGFPVWRAKVGKFGKWAFGHTAEVALRNALRANKPHETEAAPGRR